MSIADASSKLGGAFGSAIKSARDGGFVSVKDGILSLEKPAPKLLPGEKVLELFKSGGFADPGREIAEKYAKSDPGYVHLMERPDFFKTKKTNRQQISLTDEGLTLDFTKNARAGAIDVDASVPITHVSRRHPLSETIREVREAFVALGFEEMIVSFANFYSRDWQAKIKCVLKILEVPLCKILFCVQDFSSSVICRIHFNKGANLSSNHFAKTHGSR